MIKDEQQTILEVVDLEKGLSRLERRDWELWSISLLLFTVFAGGLLTYVYSETNKEQPLAIISKEFLWLVIFGLVALVVLLNIYLIDRKRSLMRLWRRYVLQADQLSKERDRNMLDALTQVYSRRFFDEVAPREALRCDRAGKPLSLLLVALDNLDGINQRSGHRVGDRLLQTVATVLRDALRSSDFAFRFAGDEFLALLPDTPAEGASIVMTRVRERVMKHDEIQKLIGAPLTVKTGHATYTKGGKFESVLEQVERAAM